MKASNKIYSLIMLFFVITATAQQGINYKAMINDDIGYPLSNTSVTVQFTILESGTTTVFSESHNPTSDDNGIIIVNIGEGNPISGTFDAIDWESNSNSLKTEIDTGHGLTDIGTTEFKVVPYTLHARNTVSKSYVDDQISPLITSFGSLLDGLTICGDEFVDLQTDEQNCGECAIICPEGFVCEDGQCIEPVAD